MFAVWAAILIFNFGASSLSFLSDIRLNTAAVAAMSIVAIGVVFAVLMRAHGAGL